MIKDLYKLFKKGDRGMIQNFDTIIELDNITLQDCFDMYNMKNMYTIIKDGKVINFKKEDK